MAHAIALARTASIGVADHARIAIVAVCALALIAAGPFLPL
jgi:hypothetical protein